MGPYALETTEIVGPCYARGSPMALSFRSPAVVRTRVVWPRRLSIVGKVAWAATTLSVVPALFVEDGAFGGKHFSDVFYVFYLASSLLQLVAVVSFIVSFVLWMSEPQAPADVHVDEDSLRLAAANGTEVLRKRDLRGALIVDRPIAGVTMPTVEVETRSGERRAIRTPDVAAATALVDELGFGGEHARRIRISLAHQSRRLLNPLVGFGAYLVFHTIATVVAIVAGVPAAAVLAPIVTILAYQLARRLLLAPEVTFGPDGVVAHRPLGKTTIRAADIASVERGPDGRVDVVDSRGVRHGLSGILCDPRRADALAVAIQRATRRLDAVPVDRVARYGRAGEPIPAWRTRIAAMVAEPGYRAAAGSVEEEAEAVLLGTTATPDQRVGAALTLRARGVAPERIRVAADAAADDDVRAALEAAADADDAKLDRALRRLRL